LPTAPNPFHHCPSRGSIRSNIDKNGGGKKSACKSRAFRILLCKIFAANILRGILPVGFPQVADSRYLGKIKGMGGGCRHFVDRAAFGTDANRTHLNFIFGGKSQARPALALFPAAQKSTLRISGCLGKNQRWACLLFLLFFFLPFLLCRG
jgi:hypothetical protein